jgi:hypothetical protein
MEVIQLEAPQANINRARFAGKDFFTFVDDIVSRIQLLFVTEFNDFIASGTGLMLIDIVSWAAETLSFYIDRQATESYLSTARLRRSVQRLTRQIGYEMRGAVAASTDLEVNLEEIWAFDVPLPEEFQFQGPNGLVFESVEEVIFPAGEGPLSPPRTVSVREGTTRVEVFTSDGTANQVFRLSPGEGKYVATASDEVRVDGATWDRSSIITFDQTDQYEISYNADPATVRFGDGVAGNIPPTGAEVRVKYLATSGRAGMNAISDTIDDVVTELVIAFQNVGLVVTNPDPVAGGDNQESLEEAKANAPGFFKARNVAVTREDYVNLSQAFNDPIAGQVAVAQAFVALGAENDLTLQILLNNIRNITEPLSASVQGSTATARGALDDAETARSAIDSQITNDIQPAIDSIVTDPLLATVSGDAETIRSTARSVRSDVSDADVLADNGLADGTLVGKDARFNDIKALLSGMSSDLSSIVSSVGSIESSVDEANSAIVVVQTNLATMLTELNTAQDNLDQIDTLVTAQFETAIETELDAIYDHVDTFLAADCQANLIEVPILVRDGDGFLQSPSVALVRNLESYLDARKEVTQVVDVVSGGPFLVDANIVGTIGVIEGFVEATVLSNVRKAIDDLLRVRPFGKNLRLSDIYSAIVPDPSTGRSGVEGVRHAIFEITGDSDFIDADGNLIITQKEVITKGSVTLSAVVADAI